MKCLIYYSLEASTVFGFHASIFLLNHLLKSFHFLLQSHFPDASSSIPPAILMCFPIQLHPQPLLHNNLNKMMLLMLSLQLVSCSFNSQVFIFFPFYLLGFCQFSILVSGSCFFFEKEVYFLFVFVFCLIYFSFCLI
jgi:hypothetical protein